MKAAGGASSEPPRIVRLKKQIAEAAELIATLERVRSDPELESVDLAVKGWHIVNIELLGKGFGRQDWAASYAKETLLSFVSGEPTLSTKRDRTLERVRTRESRLRAYLSACDILDDVGITPSPDALLSRIFEKFHRFQKQLRSRHAGRSTVEVDDEYDVQDLLHALLVVYFDDVRPEESTPSVAGAGARMDFLLKLEQIVVEAKHTRKGLGPKEVGEEIAVDIVRYSQHPDCRRLIAFVFDPRGLIGNPNGLKADLEAQSSARLKVNVFIEPRA